MPPDFDELVRRWTPYCERWAYRMDQTYPGADFWPAAGHAIHKAAATYRRDAGAGFYRWLRVNLRHERAPILRTWRRRMGRLPRSPLWEAEGVAAPIGGPDDDRLDVAAAMGRLPAEEAEAVVAIYFRGLSLRQAADATGQTLATIRGRRGRATRRLRFLLIA